MGAVAAAKILLFFCGRQKQIASGVNFPSRRKFHSVQTKGQSIWSLGRPVGQSQSPTTMRPPTPKKEFPRAFEIVAKAVSTWMASH